MFEIRISSFVSRLVIVVDHFLHICIQIVVWIEMASEVEQETCFCVWWELGLFEKAPMNPV